MARAGASGVKARVCLPWTRWAERRRRAAVAASTRRAMPEAGRPPSLVQLIQKLKGAPDSRFFVRIISRCKANQ